MNNIRDYLLNDEGFIEVKDNTVYLLTVPDDNEFMVILDEDKGQALVSSKTFKGNDLTSIPLNDDLESFKTTLKNFCYRGL